MNAPEAVAISDRLREGLRDALGRVPGGQALLDEASAEAALRWEIPKDPSFGDLSNPVAFRLAGRRKEALQPVAQTLAEVLSARCQQPDLCQLVERIEAKAGFLNALLSDRALTGVLVAVLAQRGRYGAVPRTLRPLSINIEFVSANPTGPLSVAHGRQAVVGDVLGRLLRSQGHCVTTEYYLNDEGRQIELLGQSLRVRYAELLGQAAPFPEDGYHGRYLYDIAQAFREQHGDRLLAQPEEKTLPRLIAFGRERLLRDIRSDLARCGLSFARWSSQRWLRTSGRIERALEALKARGVLYTAISPLPRRLEQLTPQLAPSERRALALELLSQPAKALAAALERYGIAQPSLRQELLDHLRALEPLLERLEQLTPQLAPSERRALALELLSQPAKALAAALERYGVTEAQNRQAVLALAEAQQATWFASTAFGDDKDRVVRKRDGELTYLAPDIAYHQWKFERGYDRLLNLWGPDHHGYIMRVKAAVAALGFPSERLTVRIVQLVTLSRRGKPVAMSKRQGEFITFREVLDEVGVDAARFFFLMRTMESHLDFDLELAKSQSQENPVYYVQYAHARICSILAKVERPSRLTFHPTRQVLCQPEERLLLRVIFQYPIVLQLCAAALEPHGLAAYLRRLAEGFHVFYTKHRVISEDRERSAARLALCRATAQVLANGLGILGVSAPRRMETRPEPQAGHV